MNKVRTFIENNAKEIRLNSNSIYQGKLCSQQDLITKLKNREDISNRESGNGVGHFIETNYIFLRVDEGYVSLGALKTDDFIQQNAACIFSEKDTLNDSSKDFVIVFEAFETLKSWQDYDIAVNYLHSNVIHSNRTRSQSRFKARSGGFVLEFGHTLTRSFLDDAKKFNTKFNEFNKAMSANTDEKVRIFDYTQISRMIKAIQQSHTLSNQEKNHLYIAVSNFAKNNVGLFNVDNWRDESLHHHYEKWNLSFNELGVEHLYSIAKKYGYKIPKSNLLNRTAGQVALEDLFEFGFGYITVIDKLYQFKDYAFNPVSDGVIRQKISFYFNRYKIDGKTPLASETHVDKALKFVKNICFKEVDDIGSIGINTKSGWLRPCYNKEFTEVRFDIFPSSPDYLCVDCNDLEYDPAVETKEIKSILNEILPEPLLKILLRTIAAPLDIERVKTKHGRIKALFCHGAGSNGKNLLYELTSRIYGEKGLSNVPLQAFKNNDQGKFGLSNLIGSKINWTSENQSIAIDNCDGLKACISNDPFEINLKNKESVKYVFQGILLFNLNKPPVTTTTQRAISSRYGMVNFPYEFVENPTLPHQKKINPELKESKQVLNRLAPAFLKLLLVEFQQLFYEGIDYHPVQDAMNQLKRESSHVYDFIQCFGVKECTFNISSISLQDLHVMYLAYCYDNDFIIDQEDDRPSIYNHPHPIYDKLLPGSQQLMKKIKEIFPNLLTRKINGRTMLAINIK